MAGSPESGVSAGLRAGDGWLARRLAAWDPVRVGRPLWAVEETAESGKLWCAAALVMAWRGGGRGRRAAVAGLAAMALAQVCSNALCKQLIDRRRPPKEWFPHAEVEDRPASSSFPSGHTAAAVAFTAAVWASWPAAGAACAVPGVLVAVERVQSGAHFPSDVAAGVVLGLTGAWAARRLPRLLFPAIRRLP
ncbi:phosphatase PAP2 family protein [Streptomyces sp. NPDC051773]|uniref:phosphatase PAP2 family protein n=1 Tax=Streptomyces TaxID=1883 RepID=UPI0029BA6EA4|nr:phosphatase PAP2 family protein [Streptomyces caniscabiei]MDX2604338.1 phosphatase PAP2 family protein [Streptomyces caniscabiei]MDX2735680.1 phosphatase PAP2 family protein [Streptomyces caniscabiei]